MSDPPSEQESDLWLPEDASSGEPQPEQHSTKPLRPHGPGLPEAIAWMIGVFALQITSSIIIAIGLIVFHFISTGQLQDSGSFLTELQNPANETQFQSEIQSVLFEKYPGIFFGGTQLAFLLATGLAVLIRFGRGSFRHIPLRGVSLGHLGLVVALMLPISLFCSQLHYWIFMAWEKLTAEFPVLQLLDELQSQHTVEMAAHHVSFPALLLMFAAVPAIAEELIFRGVIGRGLIARWGMAAGMVITSIMFAIMHLHPAHVLALMPLAVVMHVLYVATKNFWVPMGIHFTNNFLAVLFTKYREDERLNQIDHVINATETPPGALFVITGVCV